MSDEVSRPAYESLPAPEKLTDEQVKVIRLRARRGERITDLAAEFGVNRKTIRRRLNALEQAEAEDTRRKAANRLGRQAAAERRKLQERERWAAAPAPVEGPRVVRGRSMTYAEWLGTPKSLTGRAYVEASGLVRLRSPDGSRCSWRERSEVEGLLDAGWVLA